MWRRMVVLACVSLSLSLPVPPASGQEDPAARAARDIESAQRRADEAAAVWIEAAERLEGLEAELERSEAELLQLEERFAGLRRELEQVVVQRFMSTNVSTLPMLSGFRRPTDEAQASVLLGIVTETAVGDLDELDALVNQVATVRQRTERDRAAAERARELLRVASEEAQAEVIRLQAVEARRQSDAAVRRALELQRAQRARLEASGGTTAADRAVEQRSPAVFGRPGWVCPAAGPKAFADTWGAPRSGDRRHLGVDFISPRGTALVAVVSGVATSGQNRLGGNVVYLAGDDGHRYYYAHLERWGTLGRVGAGEVIGYVGDTGNAVGVPHLHFEIRPGGGPNVNPYPTVRVYC
jgi:peptidoglycan LD-endopeptidase LytH